MCEKKHIAFVIYGYNATVGAGALDSPLEATRFELSGICAEQHCADNINKIADEMSRGRDVVFLQSRNCAAPLHSLCVKL